MCDYNYVIYVINHHVLTPVTDTPKDKYKCITQMHWKHCLQLNDSVLQSGYVLLLLINVE